MSDLSGVLQLIIVIVVIGTIGYFTYQLVAYIIRLIGKFIKFLLHSDTNGAEMTRNSLTSFVAVLLALWFHSRNSK